MYLSRAHLDILLADSATYFSRLAGIRLKDCEWVNPVLRDIRTMTMFTHHGDFVGERRNFASGWAESATWSKHARHCPDYEDVFVPNHDQEWIIATMSGVLYNGQMVYKIEVTDHIRNHESKLHSVAIFNRGDLVSITGDCPFGPQTLAAFIAPRFSTEPIPWELATSHAPTVISHQYVDLLLADPATYFSTIIERNNLKLIRAMVIHEYIPAPHSFLGPDTLYIGIRHDFPNGWAETAKWCLGGDDLTEGRTIFNVDDICNVDATGVLYDNKLIYDYHIYIGDDYSTDHLTGSITFDLEGDVLASEQRNRYDYGYSFSNWELFECLAPKSLVAKDRAEQAQEARERVQFGYVTNGSYPPLVHMKPGDSGHVAWVGRRANDKRGWAKTMELTEQRDNPRRITLNRIKEYPESIAEYHYYVTWDDSHIDGKIAFGPDGVILSHKFRGFHTCYSGDNLLVMCRPY